MKMKLVAILSCLAALQSTVSAQLLIDDLSSLFRTFDEPTCGGLPDIMSDLRQPFDMFNKNALSMSLFGEALSLLLSPNPFHHPGGRAREDGRWHMIGHVVEYGPQYTVDIILIPGDDDRIHMEGQLDVPRRSPIAASRPAPVESTSQSSPAADSQIKADEEIKADKNIESDKEADEAKAQTSDSNSEMETQTPADKRDDDEKMRIYLKHVKEAGSSEAKTIAYREGDMIMQLPMGLPRTPQMAQEAVSRRRR